MTRSSMLRITVLALLMLGSLAGIRLIAQDTTATPEIDCSPESLQQAQADMAEALTLDFEGDSAAAIANMFKLGASYQQMAVACGYAPTDDEISQQVNLTLHITDLQTVIQALAVGRDVDAILAEIEDLYGDPQRGQLLFNGLEPLLDGEVSACASCHQGQVAPDVVGIYTRVTEVRLNDPALADYTLERYLVESIVNPTAYHAPGFDAALMPDQFGNRLDTQMLADILAYLESQDQELPEGE